MFLREDSPQNWDVLVSAAWIDKNKQEGLKKIADELSARLSKKELMSLSRVVIVAEAENAAGLNELLDIVPPVEHVIVEERDVNFLGLDIKRAYFITLKVPPISPIKTRRVLKTSRSYEKVH